MHKIYNKSFQHQYKNVKTISSISIILSLPMIITTATSEWLENISLIVLLITSFIFIYSIIFTILYWKSANYIKNNQIFPNWFRIITAIFFIFYLTFYQSNEKKYHLYLLLNEIRFWFFWILFNILGFILLIHLTLTYTTRESKWIKDLWLILIIIDSVETVINLILSSFIWKYQGTKSKLLVFLTIIALSYRNYKLYKKITELNSKEQESS